MKFAIAILILTVAIYLDSVEASCSGVDCAKCKKEFQGVDCNMAKLCETSLGRLHPECKKNCANSRNCYQKCVKGQKKCNSCCD
eukprot:12305.XXX_593618_593235_1 [CDS] Oithona nana genome sequencing.